MKCFPSCIIAFAAICIELLAFVASGVGQEAPVSSTREAYQAFRNVTYVKRDEKGLLLDVYVPPGEGKHPAIMLVHGGGWRFGSKIQLAHHGVRLAKSGYVAFSINYRHAPEHPFPAQIDDCRDALIWIRKNAERYAVDPTRIGAAGYSAGGHLVCLLAVQGQKPSERNGNLDTRLSAVVAGGAPCDFRSFPRDADTLAYWLGGPRRDKEDVYRSASPAAFAHAELPPMFFYNGTDDQVVPLRWTQPMIDRLRMLKVDVTWHKVQNAGHLGAFLNQEAIDTACTFLDQHLKPAPKEPPPKAKSP